MVQLKTSLRGIIKGILQLYNRGIIISSRNNVRDIITILYDWINYNFLFYYLFIAEDRRDYRWIIFAPVSDINEWCICWFKFNATIKIQ